MKKSIVVLLIVLLGACKSPERFAVCSAINKLELGEQLICESSLTFNYCRCKLIHLDSFDDVTSFEDYPFSYCDGIVGFKPQTWGEDLGPKLKALTRLKEANCGKGKEAKAREE